VPELWTAAAKSASKLKPVKYMSIKNRLIIFAAMFVAAGVYVHFFSKPSHDKLVAQLQSATTNQVIATLGQPYKRMEAASFNARASAMAQDGFPISNADTTAHGMVWLYSEGKISHTDVGRYTTVIFDAADHVAGVYTTFWSKEP
jgi:hypothetical protein